MMNFFPITKIVGKRYLRCRGVNTSQYMSTIAESETDEEGFRILNLKNTRTTTTYRRRTKPVQLMPPREIRMPVDQIWSDVWPGPRTFHPGSVPLPLRQGINKLGAPPSKWANAELLKIPNFLHLTPPAIKKHCQVLKKFCTDWPKGLETEEQMRSHFPLEVISTNYCHSSPSIRNPLARVITIRFKLSDLHFDKHSKDKFLRLVGERYDEANDTVTIVTNKCPITSQNYDYAMYLLTALYHESWVTENWESEKDEIDLEYYNWENSHSKENVELLLKMTNDEEKMNSLIVESYQKAVIDLFDGGENDCNLNKFKETSESLIFPT